MHQAVVVPAAQSGGKRGFLGVAEDFCLVNDGAVKFEGIGADGIGRDAKGEDKADKDADHGAFSAGMVAAL